MTRDREDWHTSTDMHTRTHLFWLNQFCKTVIESLREERLDMSSCIYDGASSSSCLALREHHYHAHSNLSAVSLCHLHSEASNIRRIRQPIRAYYSKYAHCCHTWTAQEPMSDCKLTSRDNKLRQSLTQAKDIRFVLTSFAFTSALAPIRSSATGKWPLQETHMSEVSS